MKIGRKFALLFCLCLLVSSVYGCYSYNYKYIQTEEMTYFLSPIEGDICGISTEYKNVLYEYMSYFIFAEDINGENLNSWDNLKHYRDGLPEASPLMHFSLLYNKRDKNIYAEVRSKEYEKRIIIGRGEIIGDNFHPYFKEGIKFVSLKFRKVNQDYGFKLPGDVMEVIVVIFPKSLQEFEIVTDMYKRLRWH